MPSASASRWRGSWRGSLTRRWVIFRKRRLSFRRPVRHADQAAKWTVSCARRFDRNLSLRTLKPPKGRVSQRDLKRSRRLFHSSRSHHPSDLAPGLRRRLRKDFSDRVKSHSTCSFCTGTGMLARMFHQQPATARDRAASTALRSVAVLDVLSSTPPVGYGRAPRGIV